MAFDFAALKVAAQQALHDTLSFEAQYLETGMSSPQTLRIRRHQKTVLDGNLAELGYAQVIEGRTRVIFNQPELDQKSITPKHGARITLPASMGGAVLILDSMEPKTSSVEQVWAAVDK